ncbi:unnamed protein product, partial [Trichogramma brassicae]
RKCAGPLPSFLQKYFAREDLSRRLTYIYTLLIHIQAATIINNNNDARKAKDNLNVILTDDSQCSGEDRQSPISNRCLIRLCSIGTSIAHGSAELKLEDKLSMSYWSNIDSSTGSVGASTGPALVHDEIATYVPEPRLHRCTILTSTVARINRGELVELMIQSVCFVPGRSSRLVCRSVYKTPIDVRLGNEASWNIDDTRSSYTKEKYKLDSPGASHVETVAAAASATAAAERAGESTPNVVVVVVEGGGRRESIKPGPAHRGPNIFVREFASRRHRANPRLIKEPIPRKTRACV